MSDGSGGGASLPHAPAGFTPGERLGVPEGRALLSGLEVCARIAVDQHLGDRKRGQRTAAFFSGYPGSPLAGLDHVLGRHADLLRCHGAVHVPGLNEELAATAVWGSQQAPLGRLAQHDGVVGFWYGKSPGVDRCGDAFKHANLTGASPTGGVLVLAGDDAMAKSSTIPNASETALFGAHIPVLTPGSHQELLDFGLWGIAASRASGCWIGIKIPTELADGFATVTVGPDHVPPNLRDRLEGWSFEPRTNLLPPTNLQQEEELLTHRLPAVERLAAGFALNRIDLSGPRDRVGVVAAGKTFGELRGALTQLGLSDAVLNDRGVRLLRIGLLWPLETALVRQFAAGIEEILVVEEKRPFLEMLMRDRLHGHATARVVGKQAADGSPLMPSGGDLTADRLASLLAPWLEKKIGPLCQLSQPPVSPGAPLPVMRTPFFCSGCPHNRSTAVPDGVKVGAGIGCHGMVIGLPRGAVSMTHMGAEGAQWIGRSPFTDVRHFVQNLGDGTFFHSGSLAIRACITAGVNITFKLLHNGTIAMTGGQDPPGAIDVPALTRLLEAEGVARTIVLADEPQRYGRAARFAQGTEVWHRDRLMEAHETLAATRGVTVILYDQRCAAELRRDRKRGRAPKPTTVPLINQAVCEGCGDCVTKSNCLSVHPVETEFGTKRQVDLASCNADKSCIDGNCPSFVEVHLPEGRALARRLANPPDGVLPEARQRAAPDYYAIYSVGIGGTGVTTVNLILGTAAAIEGLEVRGLDQTGLSQKAGPVVSHLLYGRKLPAGSSLVATHSATAFLVFDPIVGADARHLSKLCPEHTIAVVNSAYSPPGLVVASKNPAPPPMDLYTGAIRNACHELALEIDAEATVRYLGGDPVSANLFLLGAAYQVGALGVSAAAIETAIKLNGVAVAENLKAFLWGRFAVADPAKLQTAMRKPRIETVTDAAARRAEALVAATNLDGSVAALLGVRAAELIRYQGEKLARRYLDVVVAARDAERRLDTDCEALSSAVARQLHRLMAYKDEYEVARLHLLPEERARLRRNVPDGARFSFLLLPSVLRSFGVRKKLRFGSWAVPLLKLLRALRHLRGTPFDLLGLARVRRLERVLVQDYTTHVLAMIERLSAERYTDAVRWASAADDVRGYEDIKRERARRYVAQTDALGGRLRLEIDRSALRRLVET